MEFGIKLFAAVCFVLFIISEVQTKPLKDSSANTNVKESGDEMMETAESQNPFLPRFVMRRLKEKRQQARSERRNIQNLRMNNGFRRSDCPQYLFGRYYKK